MTDGPLVERLRGIVGTEHVVVVGDTFHDVDAARAAGARCVVVANERLARAPTGADHYIELVGTEETFLAGIRSLGRGGKVVIIGYTGEHLNVHPIELIDAAMTS